MSYFHDFLTFSREERRGVIILACILLVLGGVSIYMSCGNTHTHSFHDFDTRIQQIENMYMKTQQAKASLTKTRPYSSHKSDTKHNTKNTIQKIEINTADTTLLKTLKVIGTVLSKRIIKYRELLGGFIGTWQLTEVYGLSDTCYMRIKDYVFADTSLIHKIDLNRATVATLSKHPYISYQEAKAICSYRQHVHKIQNPLEIVSNHIISAETFARIRPYIITE